MKGQFFVISTVIMIYALMTMIQYVYDFSDINLVQLKTMTELDYIQHIKDVLYQTTLSSNSSLDCNKVDIDLKSTEDFLEREMISRGISLTISHTILNCPPDIKVNFDFSIKSSNIYIEVSSTPSFAPLDLVGYWRFNEGSGTTASDSSGNGNDGTLVNMGATNWVSGKYGTALQFNGIDERIRVPNDDSFDFIDESITIGFWFKNEYQLGIGYFFCKNYGNGAGTRWYGCAIIGSAEGANRGKIRCYLDDGTNTVQLTTISVYNDSAWHHVALRRDVANNKVDIFVDGTINATATDTAGSLSNMTVAPENNLFIGVRADLGSQRWFNGTIDEVKIWNRSLSDIEISNEFT